ncbi:hypothetical protein [Azohydromonas aeria]|uniref:hypothetical protein n=1 Tax=Azohydromonas aeria TaxID=2590212 RepID=UPI0012FB6476|nr:hypothetical protein [Azohydromonas aeria]
MNLIDPVVIDDTSFVSSNVAENDAAAYNPATTYAAGATVVWKHKVWRSLQDSNVGHAPDVSSAWWSSTGPTNRWAMFDRAVGTQTVGGTAITVSLMPGAIDTVVAMETQASSVRVRLVADGQTLFDKTKSMEAGGTPITDWYAYFFAPVGRAKSAVITGIPQRSDGTLTVTIAHESEARCGVLAMGQAYPLGEVLAEPSLSFTDYSRKAVNPDFGTIDIVERAWSRRNSLQIKVPTSSLSDLMDKLVSVRAKPSIYLADLPLDWLRIYGLCRRADAVVKYIDFSYVSLDLEGLI